MKRILLVEDTSFFGKMVKKQLEQKTGFAVDWARSMKEARAMLDEPGADFHAGIIDLILPDAPRGQMIREVVSRGIPAIVFTSVVSDEVRDLAWSLNVVDYILKEDSHSLDQIQFILERLEKNSRTKVLVVEDSPLFRDNIADLLRVHRYEVLCAGSGEEALWVLAGEGDVKLVLTDFYMPKMDGFELTRRIRETYPRDRLAVIGISAKGANLMAARFLKGGANDFIVKQTFLREEFYYRVSQNIVNLENIHKIREASIKDYLTGLHNRRFFFQQGRELLVRAGKEDRPITCAMIDIDHFKKVNDRFGHEGGDVVLQGVAAAIKALDGDSTLTARIGGEEFALLAMETEPGSSLGRLEALRIQVEKNPIEFCGRKIPVSVSIGAFNGAATTIEEMLREADTQLFQAKKSTRNTVIVGGACWIGK